MAETDARRARTQPQAVVVCGLPGVGKTTVGESIAGRLDAELLRTDVVRKELYPDPEYTEDESTQVYDELLQRARRRLIGGQNVVLDGTFHDGEHRERAREMTNGVDATFTLLQVECAAEVVEKRIQARTGDASDADFDVHMAFRELFDPVSIDHVTLDNTHGIDRTIRQIERHF